MKTINVVNNSPGDLLVWVQDLNTPKGDTVADGETVGRGKTLQVELQVGQDGNVNYHWIAAEAKAYVGGGYEKNKGEDLAIPDRGTQLPISTFMRKGFP